VSDVLVPEEEVDPQARNERSAGLVEHLGMGMLEVEDHVVGLQLVPFLAHHAVVLIYGAISKARGFGSEREADSPKGLATILSMSLRPMPRRLDEALSSLGSVNYFPVEPVLEICAETTARV